MKCSFFILKLDVITPVRRIPLCGTEGGQYCVVTGVK